jgi:hypothetical protein
LIAEAPSDMDITSSTKELVMTLTFTDVDINTSTKVCKVISPIIGSNSCTWTNRILTYTGVGVGAALWSAATSKTFEFIIYDLTLTETDALNY